MYNFQQGDILIFKAEESWLSKAIAWITDSDVSHAAMIYQPDVIVEMGLSGISLSRFLVEKGEKAYQLRLTPPRDPKPLIDATDAYLQNHVCYDVPALVLLGVLLIYRHIRPSTRMYRVIDLIVNAAICELDKLIDHLLKQPDSMVCSQLVCQIYADCGEDYQLQLSDAQLQQQNDDLPSLFTLATESANNEPFQAKELGNVDIEALCHELLDAADMQNDNTLVAPPNDMLGAVAHLSDKLKQLATLAGVPLNALLVTPADIAYHTKNLVRVNEVLIDRTDT